jgi:hypothetical protein
MNQTVNQAPPQPTPPTPNTQIKNPSKIKAIIISIIVVIILVLGTIVGLDLYQKKQVEDQIARGKAIIATIYDLRTQATAFYQSNHSYKDWWPASQSLIKIGQLESTAIFRKPDFQNYLIYAYIPSEQKFFCVDSYQFAGELDSISDSQIKCQP